MERRRPGHRNPKAPHRRDLAFPGGRFSPAYTRTVQTRTSEDSPIRLCEIARDDAAGGWLAITLAPGKKTIGSAVRWDRDLDTDLDRLVTLGATVLAPLLEDHELRGLAIPGLVEAARARGLEVVRFPIRDAGVPRSMPTTIDYVSGLAARVRRGERVVVHCNGGLGRSGLIAACARAALGLDTDAGAAIAAVREPRPGAIETPAQERFVEEFLDAWDARGAAPPSSGGDESRP